MQSERSLYKKYLIGILLVIAILNSADNVALGLVLQDIKADLHLSDTQLGFLTGIAFALFYTIMGIPLARWADRGNRVAIIAITTLLWSTTMALCALAGSFLQLLMIRVGVAVGEAGCLPTAVSLIADHFTRAERPRAFATYSLSGPLALLIGYFSAGWLNQFYGWRATFVLLGLPGLGVAAMVWFGLREPRLVNARSCRSTESLSELEGEKALLSSDDPNHSSIYLDKKLEAEPDQLKGEVAPSLKEVGRTLWAITTFRHLLCYWVLVTFLGFGIAQFQPAFLMRSYGLKSGELGTWFAMIWGFGGLLGTYLGGALASRCAANNERLQLKAAAVLFSSLAVPSALIYLSPNRYLAFGLMGLVSLLGAMTSGPLFALLQTLVPPRTRATSMAFVVLLSNLIGMGLGPLAAGALSDALRPRFGEGSLRYALLALSPGYCWAAWHLWRASKTVGRDLRLMHEVQSGVVSMNGSVVAGVPNERCS